MEEKQQLDNLDSCMKLLQELGRCGVKPSLPEDSGEAFEAVQTYLREVADFVRSYDFMRLGQAVDRQQWQPSAMTIQRMTRQANKLGLSCFDRTFTGIRQMVNRKDAAEAKQILAVVMTKRVQLLNVLNQYKL